jgi:ubiquinone/menaquinone biosynthesis C-methylase UbiE
LRTQETIAEHLPEGSLRILDVGGAVGVYSAWLAAQGHSVHLVDPVSRQVDLARRAAGSPPLFSAEVGDARHLHEPDASYDAVLLLGPLYHLVERSDRIRALAEARRVVKPGGPIFAAAISRFASLMDGLTRGFIFDSRFRSIVERDLHDGQHRNPSDRPEWFTTAYFHDPAELVSEGFEAGLQVREVVGLEGFAGWLPSLLDRWEEPDVRDAILFAARATGTEASVTGMSAHLLLVAQRGADGHEPAEPTA